MKEPISNRHIRDTFSSLIRRRGHSSTSIKVALSWVNMGDSRLPLEGILNITEEVLNPTQGPLHINNNTTRAREACSLTQGVIPLIQEAAMVVIGMIKLIFQPPNKDLLLTNQLVSCLLY